jgi:hypothetical protein
MKSQFRSHIAWWDSLTKEDKENRFRFLSEKAWNYKDLPTWSQNSVKNFFERTKKRWRQRLPFVQPIPTLNQCRGSP